MFFQFLQALSQRQYHSSSSHEYIFFAPLFLHEWIRKSISISERDVAYAIQLAQQGKIAQFEELYEEES
jgi:hypothetical protein